MKLILNVIEILCFVAYVQGEPLVIKREKLGQAKNIVKDFLKGLPCRERITGFDAHNITIGEECKKGQIRWSLTKRHLNLDFDVAGPKEFCINSRAPKGLEKFTAYRMNDEKLELIGTPSKGKDVCTPVDKGTTIRITPRGYFYGLYVRYTMVAQG